uniref:Rad50/SbcC-type AAA domain-containing protein n=1 Tax=viral metagenome TaxID=1070528 RepID=A0A6M3K087_9ZZZZ
MKQLQLQSLELFNFITYKEQIFDFRELFVDSNILLIYGKNFDDSNFANDNGSGKSIIYIALIFLLFNRTTINSDKNLLVGQFSNFMSVKGVFKDDNNLFEIKRFRKHKVHKNNVIFKINNKIKKKSTPTEMDFLIRQTLNIDYKRFVNTSVFESSDERTRLIHLGDKEAKDLLSKMKGLDIFSKCQDIVKKDVNNLDKKIFETNSKIDATIDKIENLKSIIKHHTKLSDVFDQEKTKKIKQITLDNTTIEKEIRKAKAINETEIEKLEEEINELKSVKKPNLKKTQDKLSIINNSLQVINDRVSIIQSNIQNLKDSLRFIDDSRDKIGRTCKHCGSIIKGKNIKRHKKSITNELDLKKKNIFIIMPELERLLQDKNKTELEIRERQKLQEQYIRSRVRIKSIGNEINQIKTSMKKEVDLLKNKINENQNRIIKIKLEQDTSKEVIQDLKRKKKDNKNKISNLKVNNRISKYKLKYKSAWKIGFGKEEIQSFALQSTIKKLNQEIVKISEQMTDGFMEIELSPEKKRTKSTKNIFEFKINIPGKKNLPFKAWSTGQRRRVEVIVSFALMNLEEAPMREIFLDEIFDGLDETGILKSKELLEIEAKESNKRFIVFSHSKDVRRLFPHRVYIRLKNGKSKLMK